MSRNSVLLPRHCALFGLLALAVACAGNGADTVPAGVSPAVQQDAGTATADAGAATADAGTATGPHDVVNQVKRPAGWAENSHSKGAAPAYELLFADDSVQRLDLVISAATYAAMLKNLEQLHGAAGGGTNPGGGGGGGPGGNKVPQDGLDACKGKKDNDPCTVQFKANKATGTCHPEPKAGGALFCHLKPGGGKDPGGDGKNPGGGGPGGLDGLPKPDWVQVLVKHDGRQWTHVGMRFKATRR